MRARTLEGLLLEVFKRVDDEFVILKGAVANGGVSSSAPHANKLKVPDPKTFNGIRDAKELENFLWDIKQYFKAAQVPKNERVTIISMYLAGDAKLWWHTRMDDDSSASRPSISTWDMLKRELNLQFLPCSNAWIVRDALKKLKQTSSVREYVKQFSSLMLDIKNMYEEDKMLNFTLGLQGWA